MKSPAPMEGLPGWDRLSHGGLLLDPARLGELARFAPAPLCPFLEQRLRQRAGAVLEGRGDAAGFAAFVLEEVCGFCAPPGDWSRGNRMAPREGRKAVTGETVRPRQLWAGPQGARLPVFLDDGIDSRKRLGIGRGRRVASRVVGWLRAGGEPLALLTNGREWRLLFAGLDYEAWCQWDLDLWFDEGRLSPQVTALRTLLNPELWIPEAEGAVPPLLRAIRDTRKGQAELSEVLGERVREAVEILIQGHGDALRERCAEIAAADMYRAACRVAMRLVVILFAEARGLLPRNNALYDASYGLNGLFERLERTQFRWGLGDAVAAWPRVLALFALVRDGSHHPALPVPAYGGELFASGREEEGDGVGRALAVFETACFERDALPDRDVHTMLRRLTRTTVRIRQGRAGTRVAAPVDFSDLSSEYIGVLYEGLLDYELKAAPDDDPVVFLAVGDQAALPLSRLEAMDERALKALFESLKKADQATPDDAPEEEAEHDGPAPDPAGEAEATQDDRQHTHARAAAWARRAAQAAGLVRKPRGRDTPERRLKRDRELAAAAEKLIARVVLPGAWYLVRWGGTRKGSGSFYTRPGLAVPTVQRTLRPLAYDPPADRDGRPDTAAPAARWTPKLPERILALTVCDPACGSGTFPLAALRFLTDALYASLQHHGRLRTEGERTLVRLLGIHPEGDAEGEGLTDELIPCRPDDDDFEPRLRAVLRRYVVERCLYAVDLDPLAVELCRLSLWIETMDRNLPFGFLDHKIKCGNALIGAWFDQFRHYPVMAWKHREGGDRDHKNGVHFAEGARTSAFTEFVKETLTPDLQRFLQGPGLFEKEDLLARTAAAHDEAFAVLEKCHALPVRDAAERAAIYRSDFLGSPARRALQEAMDRWCACWFWPAEAIGIAPLPTTFADPPSETRAVAERIAAEMRFFHWELEFPDVFREAGAGFDAILGNPPWDVAKPNSKEFFSNLDPLYRSYGKQEAVRRHSEYFADAAVERAWLDYCGHFRAQSKFVAHAANPFGDPDAGAKSRFAITRGKSGAALHRRWRDARASSTGYTDPDHPFRHQGSADLNLYKLFLEAAHALLRGGGRLGFLIPSGLYSDHGTGALRDLFLKRCRWEWLFGFENREGVFPIHRSYKFNPVVVEKGGTTDAIRTAFMRRNLDDWERAEEVATPYSRARIERFSPRSRAILEIQSPRDLEILEKIYANSVLLGDDGPDGWGIRYAREFDMTNDSRLFPPRPQWEAQGYRPDEYSRWLLGDWHPIGELWAELGVDPSRPEPAGVALEDWLFDTTAAPDRRAAEARFAHGHLLKPGDVQRTDWRSRCAQPPYDRLPIPRDRLPTGVVLSREGNAWIAENAVEGVALPVIEGRMIGQLNASRKGWVSGKGRRAVWREIPPEHRVVEPQYLMARENFRRRVRPQHGRKVGIMDITSSTNSRTMIASRLPEVPCGNKVPVLTCDPTTVGVSGEQRFRSLAAVLNSLAFDFPFRIRFPGLSANWFVVKEAPLPRDLAFGEEISDLCVRLSGPEVSHWTELAPEKIAQAPRLALTPHERLRLRVILEALIAAAFGLDRTELLHALNKCDLPRNALTDTTVSGLLNPKGFWRVDKDKDPELRHTVLTLVAYHDLEARIRDAGGDRKQGIEAFLNQNHGEGWMLPETLRLADYGLGHDDRARHSQPVASRLGPRFFDWQLAQTPEEAWRECHLHARNLLGEHGYRRLLEDLRRREEGYADDDAALPRVAEPDLEYNPPKPPSPKAPTLF